MYRAGRQRSEEIQTGGDLHAELPKNDAVPPETWTRNAEGKLLNGQAKSLDGTTWTPGMDLVYSPEAPDSVWEEAGRLRAEPLRRIRQKCPIAIVLNGGEYGLSVPGWAKKVWQQDPAILKAKGDKSWADYASQHKGHAELLIANAVRKAVPDRLLYIYYTTSGGELRNHISGVENWGFAYEDMKAVSDLASSQAYYKHYNSGWTGDNDSLSQILNARAREIALGQPLSYNWLCGGWPRQGTAGQLHGQRHRHLHRLPQVLLHRRHGRRQRRLLHVPCNHGGPRFRGEVSG